MLQQRRRSRNMRLRNRRQRRIKRIIKCSSVFVIFLTLTLLHFQNASSQYVEIVNEDAGLNIEPHQTKPTEPVKITILTDESLVTPVQIDEATEPNQEEETTPTESSSEEYTIGDIAELVEKMNDEEGMKVEFSWDTEKFTEDSLFIDYIRDLMDQWYEDGKITAKWEPDEERFTSTTPYYTEEQGDYVSLANMIYAEEGILMWKCSFDEAILAHLFAGTVAMNRATDEKERFGKNLTDALYNGRGYHSRTRRMVEEKACERELVYALAEIIIQYGPIGPDNLIFQAQSKQGTVFCKIYNQYFGLEKVN